MNTRMGKKKFYTFSIVDKHTKKVLYSWDLGFKTRKDMDAKQNNSLMVAEAIRAEEVLVKEVLDFKWEEK